MKKVTYEIKLEKSVKIILGIFAVGVFLNAFATPIGQELFGINEALADYMYGEMDVTITNWPR
tara:strand:+ start:345 stop:533 length:189 start_codon:yes stop_codon:yes gene_type:complete